MYHPTCIYDVLIGGDPGWSLSPVIRKAQDLVPLTASHPPPAAGKAILRAGASCACPPVWQGPKSCLLGRPGHPTRVGSGRNRAASRTTPPPSPKQDRQILRTEGALQPCRARVQGEGSVPTQLLFPDPPHTVLLLYPDKNVGQPRLHHTLTRHFRTHLGTSTRKNPC